MGAIPTKKGVTVKKLRDTARKQIKKGLTFSIVTESQLKKKFGSIINKRRGRKK